MVRRRFLVALVPPGPLTDQLRGLRGVLDGPAQERIAPHVTLVPPFNTPAERVVEVRRALRSVAVTTEPFTVQLGPVSSFAPSNATLHLSVGGDDSAVAALGLLRETLRVGPMDRPDRHEFVPHLTLRRDAPPAVTDAAPAVLPGRLGPWEVDRLHLLEQFHGNGGTAWSTVAEEPFGGPVVVGRGGVELHLRTIGVDELRSAPVRSPDGVPLVVVAEPAGEPGRVIATAIGATGAGLARLGELVVDEEHRGMGVARQVLARWCTDAARRGATVAVAQPGSSEAGSPDALVPHGFTLVGEVAVRELTHTPG